MSVCRASILKQEHPPRLAHAAGVTEIVLSHQQSFPFMLPTLAHMSNEPSDRWFTWMPPVKLTRSDLVKFGFNLSRMRLIYPRNSLHCYWLTQQALLEANSNIVVASPGILSDWQMAYLEFAAGQSDATALLIRCP